MQQNTLTMDNGQRDKGRAFFTLFSLTRRLTLRSRVFSRDRNMTQVSQVLDASLLASHRSSSSVLADLNYLNSKDTAPFAIPSFSLPNVPQVSPLPVLWSGQALTQLAHCLLGTPHYGWRRTQAPHSTRHNDPRLQVCPWCYCCSGLSRYRWLVHW